MFGDTTSAIMGSSAFAAALVYAGISGFITGPVMTERMIEKNINWPRQCRAHISAEVQQSEKPKIALPKIGCGTLFGWFGREGAEYCRVHGHLFEDNIFNSTIDAANNAAEAANRKRREFAAGRSRDRCDCSVTTTIDDQRLSVALYAGSWRLVEPAAIKNLKSEQIKNLNTPACKMTGGVQ
jgi:hypothetical protein